MGNNNAFRYFEETVIKIYDLGVLTLPVLEAIASEFESTDIDTGGSQDLKSKNGKSIAQICVELVLPKFQPGVREEDDSWWDAFSEIMYDLWDWR